ncbi:MAG: DUF4493 domain-containing protein [Muribaculaceae bacterium]|nr:DUF4493 domain-containing protein [Muribaculaceae bacterium]
MRKTILLGLGALAAAVSFSGCSDDWGFKGDSAGRISPLVGIDTEAVTSRSSDPASRADGDDITVADLSLMLVKTDGSYAHTWPANDFPVNQEFAVGEYTLEAFYGNVDEEGFGKPAYSGKQSLTVAKDQTTSLALTASLANCRFIIRYTDAFQGYMTDWKASIKSAGNPIEYPKGETAPLYVKPGEVSINISVTKPNGLGGNFSLPAVQAQARHQYTVTVDVNDGGVGDAQFTVTFDENLQTEDVDIDISDAVLSAAAPTVEAEGYDPALPVEVVAGLSTDKTMSMNIMAMGGIGSVVMETASEYLLSKGWPAKIDLVAADAAQQELLKRYGLNALGVWRNVDKMAVLDFSDVVKNLGIVDGDNTSTFTVTATDKLSRVTEPLTLTVKAEEVVLELASAGSFYEPGAPIDINLAFNGTDVASDVTFKIYYPSANQWRETKVLAVSEPRSRAVADYTVTIATDAVIDDDLRVQAFCAGKGSEITSIGMAPFTIEGSANDVFARHAFVKVTGTDGAEDPDPAAVSFVARTGSGDYTALESEYADGYYRIYGLNPATAYEVKAVYNDMRTKVYKLTTEEILAVPNGDFEDLEETMSKTDMPESGQWSISRGINYQNTLSYTVSEPTGWASVNGKTAAASHANQNSWFVVPSTFNTSGKFIGQWPTIMTYARNEDTPESYKGFAAQNGSNAMVVRNVAWDAAGITPELWLKAFSPQRYNSNIPSVAERSAGKLFLGSYSYVAGMETYNEGVSFASRPSSLSGYYRYARGSQDSAEKGTVKVTLLNGNTVVATGEAALDAAGDFTAFNIPLTYAKGAPKATELRIMIASSNHASYNQADETAAIKTDNKVNNYEAYSIGATLVIDNLTFNY